MKNKDFGFYKDFLISLSGLGLAIDSEGKLEFKRSAASGAEAIAQIEAIDKYYDMKAKQMEDEVDYRLEFLRLQKEKDGR